MDGKKEGRKIGCIHAWVGRTEKMDGWRMEGWMGGWEEGRTDAWMDGCMVRQATGWGG